MESLSGDELSLGGLSCLHSLKSGVLDSNQLIKVLVGVESLSGDELSLGGLSCLHSLKSGVLDGIARLGEQERGTEGSSEGSHGFATADIFCMQLGSTAGLRRTRCKCRYRRADSKKYNS